MATGPGRSRTGAGERRRIRPTAPGPRPRPPRRVLSAPPAGRALGPGREGDGSLPPRPPHQTRRAETGTSSHPPEPRSRRRLHDERSPAPRRPSRSRWHPPRARAARRPRVRYRSRRRALCEHPRARRRGCAGGSGCSCSTAPRARPPCAYRAQRGAPPASGRLATRLSDAGLSGSRGSCAAARSRPTAAGRGGGMGGPNPKRNRPTVAAAGHGVTAVPGPAAGPVLDLHVAVPGITDEACRPGFESIGLVLWRRESGHWFFRPTNGGSWTAHAHVCESGAAGERGICAFTAAPERSARFAASTRDSAARGGHEPARLQRRQSSIHLGCHCLWVVVLNSGQFRGGFPGFRDR